MPSFLRIRLRRLLNKTIHSLGFEIARKGWEAGRLRKDFRIATLIDIGVGVGRGTPELYAAFPEARLLLVDASPVSWPVMDKILQFREGHAAKMAAGSAQGLLDFYSYPDAPGVSSFLKRAEHAQFRCETVKIQIETLDMIVARSGLPGPYGIKIDVEGFELEVLRGASDTLKSTQFVLFESQIESIDPKPYTQAEIFGVLEAAGFELYDIVWVAYEHATRRTRQADLLFRRSA
jgi:FkbM family methyltransferase